MGHNISFYIDIQKQSSPNILDTLSGAPDPFTYLSPAPRKQVLLLKSIISISACAYVCFIASLVHLGAPLTQWVKRWPTDLAVVSSSPARGEIFPTVYGVPLLHTAFHYQRLIVLI